MLYVHETVEPRTGQSGVVSWLPRYVCHRCDVSLAVQDLGTGASRDVHGQVALHPPKRGSQVLQFKVTDAAVSFFAKGTSAAVL